MEFLIYSWVAILLILVCYLIYNLIKLIILSIQIHRDEKELRILIEERAELEKELAKLNAELKEIDEEFEGEDK